MKLLLISLIAAAAAIAQIPEKSTVGSTTIYVQDTTISVPYGPSETRAVVSACMPNPATSITFFISYRVPEGSAASMVTTPKVGKTDLGYCAAIVAPIGKDQIENLQVDQTNSTTITPPLPPSGGNTAVK